MKKLSLALAISALAALTFSSAALAAFRADSDARSASDIVVERAANLRLAFINDELYPDTVADQLAGDRWYREQSSLTPLVSGDRWSREAEFRHAAPGTQADMVTTSALESNGFCDADCQEYVTTFHYAQPN